MLVIVTGSKHWTDAATMRSRILLLPKKKTTIVLEGGERGAHLMARGIAVKAGMTVKTVNADWECYGAAASPIRNRYMIEQKPELVLAFCDDLRFESDTKDCLARAKAARIPFEHIYSSKERTRIASQQAHVVKRQIKDIVTMKNKTAKKTAKKTDAAGGRAWNQTYTFAREAKVEPIRETIMGCVYAAIKKLKTGDATAITELAVKNGLSEHTGQDARVQTLVMLNRLAADKVVTKTRGESKVPATPRVAKKADKAASAKKATKKASKKGKAPRVKLVAPKSAGEDATL